MGAWDSQSAGETCRGRGLGLSPWPVGSALTQELASASKEQPRYRGLEEAVVEPDTDIRIFGKPYTKVNRRMGVVVCNAPNGSDMDTLRNKCKAASAKVEVY